MKKMTFKQKMHQIRKARDYRNTGKLYRHKYKKEKIIKSMWYRGSSLRAQITNPEKIWKFPTLMCFGRTADKTLQSFEYVRKSLNRNQKNRLWFKPNLNINREVKVSNYIAMDHVDEISTSAALVLAAEYERRRMTMDESPPIFDIENWNSKLLYKLDQIGFFERFGYTIVTENDKCLDTDVLTVPFYSGTSSEMDKVDKKLIKLVEHIDSEFQISQEMRMALNSAVGEAANNSREHAYESYHDFEYPNVGLWWATGAASRNDRKIVISLYDQGVTIPISYPRLGIFKKVSGMMNLFDTSSSSKYANDAKLIQAATLYGKSGRAVNKEKKVTSDDGGYGLPQMKEAINLCGGGELMILSRGGKYIYNVNNGCIEEQLDTFEYSIGGTLIEWTVTLQELELNDA